MITKCLTYMALAACIPSILGSPNPKGSSSKQPEPRQVYMYFGIKDGLIENFANKPKWPAHSSLWINEDGKNKAIKIDLILESKDPPGQPVVNVLELPRGVPEPGLDVYKVRLEIGRTPVQNVQLLQGKGRIAWGIVMDAVNADARYRVGPKNVNDLNSCHSVLERIVAKCAGLSFTADARKWTKIYNTWTVDKGFDVTAPIKHVTKTGEKFEGSKDNEEKGRYDTILCNTRKSKRDDVCSLPDEEEGRAPRLALIETAASDKGSKLPSDQLSLKSTESFSDQAAPPDTLKDSRTTIVKVAGELKSYLTLAKPALEALGWAGAAVGAAFVIIDLVDHKWVGAAIGGIGLAAGVGAGVAISGPVGWIVGGLIAALFAILPGAFGHTQQPPNRANIEEIIQFKMFGDAKHTGNEKCREDSNEYKGNPDCQALYGAGTLSMSLGMPNFDAVLFLSHFNDGYAMTIPEIAKNFYVVDSRKQDDGKDKMATIDCGMGRGDGYFQCLKPSFKLNRELFHIDGIGDTADKIFDQIAPKGNCKLITFPGDAYFADVGLTFGGLPSSIVCAVADTLSDGTVVTADVVQNPDNGIQPAPEPPVPFANLAQDKYACLIHSGDAPFCLPPGTYRKQSGLGFEIVNVDSLTLPNQGSDGAWSLQVHYKTKQSGHLKPQTIERGYTHNEDPAHKSDDWQNFSNDMHGIAQENEPDETHFTISGPGDGPDPVCCIFTEPSFAGNVWCVGVGGGDVPSGWKDVAQSISCHGGAQAYLYADHYNDVGGSLILHNVEDLKGQLYDNDSKSFSKNVKALWVFKP